jgi:ABC-type sugar transport system ATPase subunit
MSGISIRGLRFERDGRMVLDLPALNFPAGSTTAVFGPNGSGKSTLLRVIAGLDRPSAGTVTFGAGERRRGDVAIAFQEAVFLRGDVRSNLALGLELRGIEPAERERRIERVARECGIASLLDRRAARLSAGEAQRVNLARTLALAAPVMLLDEPLAGVDRIMRRALLEELPLLLRAVPAATTTLVVTHDREEAFRLAERLVVLIGGRVTAEGESGAVYRAPPDRATAELLGYAILETDSGKLIALPPGGLRRGPGAIGFELQVARVVDMGRHRHATGWIGGAAAELRLGWDEPVPAEGATVPVHAAEWVAVEG